MKYQSLALAFLLALLSSATHAQRSVKDSIVGSLLIQASYAFQIPGADLTTNFGVNSSMGAVIGYKTNKNWLWNAHLGFIFGDQVKGRDQLFSLIGTQTGEIIDGDGVYTSLALFERGYHLQAKAGKIFPVGGVNPNSGIYIQTGLGFLAHRIRIETQFGTAPQLRGDYAKGYDRMRGGFAHSLEAGYLFMGNSRVLNFSLGLEFVHAYTKPMRDYDFNLMQQDVNSYTDHYYGIRLNWIIPAYKRPMQKYYYF